MPTTIPVRLDRTSQDPLYRQIETQIRAAIAAGLLRHGTLLPGIRTLASTLGIAPITVRTAYEQLAAEGFVEAEVGRGTKVIGGRSLTAVAPSRSPFPRRAVSLVASRWPAESALIDLRPGVESADGFPFRTWERLLRETVREIADTDSDDRQRPTTPAGGDLRLREVLAERLGATRGIACTAEQVVITTGDWATLSTILDVWSEPNQPAVVEDPAEPFVRELLARRGRRLVAVPVDQDGVRVSVLRSLVNGRGPALVHVNPAWSAIAGGVLSDRRRTDLLAWAGTSVRIVEDDRDGEIRYEGQAPPALAEGPPLAPGHRSSRERHPRSRPRAGPLPGSSLRLLRCAS
jgi:GntR family transcriptional regulator/MocR family aminotransferase